MALIKVEFIDKKAEICTELRQIKTTSGWKPITAYQKSQIIRIVYLGKCAQDGDMFAVYWSKYISLGKGVLHNGSLYIPD